MVMRLAAASAFLLMAAAGWSLQSDLGSGKSPTAIPLYLITFKESEPIKGVGAAPAFRLPFQCAGDGTIFLTTVQPFSPDAPLGEPSPNPFLLISVLFP